MTARADLRARIGAAISREIAADDPLVDLCLALKAAFVEDQSASATDIARGARSAPLGERLARIEAQIEGQTETLDAMRTDLARRFEENDAFRERWKESTRSFMTILAETLDARLDRLERTARRLDDLERRKRETG